MSAPHQRADIDPAEANAGGSIGIIVDIISDEYVTTVGANDDGTSVNLSTGKIISGGFAPTRQSCAWSIDERRMSNEWLARGYKTIGEFAFGPILVRHSSGGETQIARDVAFGCFPEFRIFSVLDGRFVEFDRQAMQWSAKQSLARPGENPKNHPLDREKVGIVHSFREPTRALGRRSVHDAGLKVRLENRVAVVRSRGSTPRR